LRARDEARHIASGDLKFKRKVMGSGIDVDARSTNHTVVVGNISPDAPLRGKKVCGDLSDDLRSEFVGRQDNDSVATTHPGSINN
jgi:hypothetical protein